MERRYYLEQEKQLTRHHHALRLDLSRSEALGDDEVSSALQATLWTLGVAIQRSAELANKWMASSESDQELPCVSQNSQMTVEEMLSDAATAH